MLHKGSLADEDDARTSNTDIVQRKCVIRPSTIKNNCNTIECCNNTHHGTPSTGKQMSAYTSDHGDASPVTCDVNKL